MTVFRVTTALSNQTMGYGVSAFQQGSVGESSLIVESGAYLRTSGVNATAVRLDGPGAWRVNVDGEVKSEKDSGLLLNTGIQDLSKIVVGDAGKVSGAIDGIYALSGVTITNHGFIEGQRAGIEFDNDGQNYLINHGSITGGTYAFIATHMACDDTIKNSGTMTGRMLLGGGNDRLENSGVINGDPNNFRVDLGSGNDTVVNTGEIALQIIDADGNDAVSNGGVIKGFVDLGDGADVFTNLARVTGRMTSGAVTGEIRLGNGGDKLFGGKFVEDYRDDGGSDRVELAGGGDVVRAKALVGIDGIDRIDGGKGIDTYDASDCGANVYVNLSATTHRLPVDSGHLEIKAGTSLGIEVAGTKSDILKSFENIFTGTGNDIVYGSSKGNYISASDGDDTILGQGGDDYLIGGLGTDRLIGGAGYEMLVGGLSPDQFAFDSIKDSVTGARRDVILDFEDGDDTIDIRGIDAVEGGRDDAFVFVGMDVEFSGEAGELRTRRVGDLQVIEGDVNGDGKADFSIGVADAAKAFVFASDDFTL